jgi:hypothetical protein
MKKYLFASLEDQGPLDADQAANSDGQPAPSAFDEEALAQAREESYRQGREEGRREGALEAETRARDSSEAKAAQATEAARDAVQAVLRAGDAAYAAMVEETVALVVGLLGVLVPALVRQNAEDQVRSLVTAVVKGRETAGGLAVKTGKDAHEVAARILQEAGVVCEADASLPAMSVRAEWASGRASVDPEETGAEIEAAVAAFIAELKGQGAADGR